ncbi:MAG: AraC family transcriptional regulator [Bacteroidaceae bacterium]|nr:AraC family transcriptional regulator [Bacteroidaceae bacterium]
MEKKMITDLHKIDAFKANGMFPSAQLPNEILLFDNIDGRNPFLPLVARANKLWQTTIYFQLEGEASLRINNKDVIVRKNQLLITHEECIVEFINATDDSKFYCYVIYPDTMQDIFTDIHLNYNKSRFSYSYKVGDMSKENVEYFLDIYEEIKRDMQMPEYQYQLNYSRYFLNIVYVYIINKFYSDADMQADPSSRQYDMFCKFMDALNKHADSERSVQFYANLLGITSKYLSFVCLQYSKRNASSWIDEYVVAKARALQNVHHYNIKRISQELNFISPSSFTRFFKRVTGAPPTK